jgi:hypothetical protein
MKYYLIYNPDGDTRVYELDKAELLAKFEEDGYSPDGAMESLESADTNTWGEDRYLIIKGEIVTPLKREIVTKIELP